MADEKKFEDIPPVKPELTIHDDNGKWMDEKEVMLDFLNPKTSKTESKTVTVRELITLFNNQSHRLAHNSNMLNIINGLFQVSFFELRRIQPDNRIFKDCDPKYTAIADKAIEKMKEQMDKDKKPDA